MSPELVGIITLFGTIVALGAALFGTLKWFANYIDKRFEQVDKRFDQVDKRFEQMDKRFDQVDKRFEQIDKRFDQVDKRFEQIERRFEQIERRIEQIERDISQLREGLARLEGMFEGAFERVPRARPDNPQGGSEAVASAGGVQAQQ